MNVENLKKLEQYLRTVPQEMFDIEVFRKDDGSYNASPICGTVGCALGHGTALDPENFMKNFTTPWRDCNGKLTGETISDFYGWAGNFFGGFEYLPNCNGVDRADSGYDQGSFYEWDLVKSLCFSSAWSNIDNTVEGARKRIQYFIDKEEELSPIAFREHVEELHRDMYKFATIYENVKIY